MSKDKCKVCGEGQKEIIPLSGEFLGQSLSKIVNGVIQTEISAEEIGKTALCNTCAGAIFLVNTKIIEFKRAFQKKVQSVPQTAKSPKKEPKKVQAEVEVVQKTKGQPHKQLDGDITSYLKPKVATKTKTSSATQNVAAKKSTTKNEKNTQNDNTISSSVTSSESENKDKETNKPHSENKPARIRTRRQTIYSFECEICSFQSGVIKDFQNHMTVMHNDKMPRIFKCTLCDSKYVAKSSLDKHVIKCSQYKAAEKATSSENKDDDSKSANQRKPSSNGISSSATQDNDSQSDSDENIDSIIYENSLLSSTKLKEHKKVKANSSSRESDEEEKDETALDFPIEIAKIRPVIKKSSSPNKNTEVLKKSPKKRTLSNVDDSSPIKKIRLSNGDTTPTKESISSSPKASTSSETIEKAKQQVFKKPAQLKNEKSTFQFVCTHCKEVVVGANEFKKHLSREHNDADNHIFACEHCPKKYLSYKSLTTHLDKYHATTKKTKNAKAEGDTVVIGGKNNKSQKSKDKLNNTTVKEKESTNDLTDECETPKKRKRKSQLSESQANITIDSTGTPEASKSKKNLSVSFDLKEEEEEQPKPLEVKSRVQCTKCFKTFKSDIKLERHKSKGDCEENKNNTHSLVFHCDTCGKAFSEEHFLKIHIKNKHVPE